MKHRKVAPPDPPWPLGLFNHLLCFLICVALYVAGCGVPGDPIPPSPPIPVAVRDLAARQLGDGVLLIFSPPNKSTRGERLKELPTLEVLRGALRQDGTPDPKSFHVVDTVPGPILSGYVQQGKVEFLEPVAPEETRVRAGEIVVYRVRTRVSERKSSADSNDVTVQLYAVPERIGSVETRVTEKSIELSWRAPAHTSAGDPLPAIKEYRVFRGELEATSAEAAQKDLRAAVWNLPLVQIATTTAPEFADTGFDYGKTYAYVIRSVIDVNGKQLESANSSAAILTPKDIFPPAPPQDVVSALLPGATPGTAVVDLSWAINLETDLAGYRVYRSEREGERGPLLTPDLLLTPAYRDSSVVSGRKYWYTVTAVDRAGNESGPSAALYVEAP